ncbi:MAG: hypothetical protein M1818_002652 [Claussenomyces sp. TS43310]|nr:MAG: hypothetical protein M1818_002652 [Claussenomyces sp. TS43310]
MSKRLSSLLPAGMDGPDIDVRYGDDGAAPSPSPSLSAVAQHSKSIKGKPGRTIRAVTPDNKDEAADATGSHTPTRSQRVDNLAVNSSPRYIAGGEKPQGRRQGLIFDDSFDSSDTSPNRHFIRPAVEVASSDQQASARPRTRTLDDVRQARQCSSTLPKSRRRIGSIHSSNSTSFRDVSNEVRPEIPMTIDFPSNGSQAKSSRLQKAGSIKERSGRRFFKPPSSPRPASPLPTPTTSVDSLPFPMAVTDPNRVLKLMTILAGRMRGSIEFQLSSTGLWKSGVCYIDDSKGSLMYEDEDQGLSRWEIVSDLRGCQVRPRFSAEKQAKCLDIKTLTSLKISLFALASTEFDHWLAALLYWQQLRPGRTQTGPPVAGMESPKPSQSSSSSKEATIIKIGNLLLWDKSASSTNGNRTSSRGPQPLLQSWRRVSCTLQDNGELTILTDTDAKALSVIQLSQLSRCAIQQLDRTVLNEEYCIAILPQYSPTSTAISIIRPICIALETRVLFEVWFVLLRAFAIPEIYGPQASLGGDDRSEGRQDSAVFSDSEDMFRIEKSLKVRIVEAKVRKAATDESLLVSSKHSAKPEQDLVTGDYFAEVILDGELRSKTNIKPNTKNPFWREDCVFNDLPATLPELSVILKRKGPTVEATPHVQRSSTSIISSELALETVCGVVQINLDQMERGKDTETWWPILDKTQGTIGEMFVKIRHDELVVLMAKDYQPISELLHRFSSLLTIQIAQTVPTNLRYLSEIFMNIFQASGQANDWLVCLVEDEMDGIMKEMPVARFRFNRRVGSNDSFESVGAREQSVRDMGKSLTGEANLLFRGNSLLTQALDFHMRRLGKEYLNEVLRDKIYEIDALGPNCEVDPSRVDHGDDLAKNWIQLKALTSGIWESIATSAKSCPPALRQILRFIRAVADDRYGNFLRNVPYTSVSGFLFLRFFCPAILNPKLFDLLHDHPRPKAQRTLTLIAKSLQALANLSTFGQKESWMEPMNRFLASNRQGIKDFIDGICDIPVDRNILAPPASYSTPLTILGRLPPTSKEGFPSLPYLIDQPRCFAALVKLWLESTSLSTATHQLEGNLLKFHKLCLGLQRRTDECLAKAENATLDRDDGDLQWDHVLGALERTQLRSPNSADPSEATGLVPASFPSSPPQQLSPLSTQRPSQRPPGSSGGASNDTERRDRHSFWEATFGKDANPKSPRAHSDRSTDGADEVGIIGTSPPTRGASSNGFRGAPKTFLGFGALRKMAQKGESGGSSKKNHCDEERDDVKPAGGRIRSGSTMTPGGVA